MRVQAARGGAQIHVNGEPVPGRFFYATRINEGYATTDSWQEHGFEFVPFMDVNGRATLHLKFANLAAEYQIRDIRFYDTQTGQTVIDDGSFGSDAGFGASWVVWPQGAGNTVGTVTVESGAVRVVVRTPDDGVWPDFKLFTRYKSLVKGRRYRCSFSMKGTDGGVVMPMVYAAADAGRVSYVRIGAPSNPLEREVVMARDAGVKFISIAAPACWDPPGMAADWAPLDAVIEDVLRLHPGAWVVPRVDLNAPSWWKKLHPETLTKYEDGSLGSYTTVSSRIYRDEVSAQVEKMSRHLLQA